MNVPVDLPSFGGLNLVAELVLMTFDFWGPRGVKPMTFEEFLSNFLFRSLSIKKEIILLQT